MKGVTPKARIPLMESLGTHAKKLPLEDPDDPTAFAAALIDRVIAIQGEVAAKSKEAFERMSQQDPQAGRRWWWWERIQDW